MRRAIAIAVLLAGCGGGGEQAPVATKTPVAKTCEPTHGHVEAVDPAPESTPSRVKLGPGMELKATERNLAAGRIGEPLVVTGTVTGTDCEPLPGATVYAWQTNGDGRYGPTRDGRDLCCYLTGAMRTGEDGRYAFESVMPKGYDGGRAHIHFQIGHPETEGVTTELVLDTPVADVDYDVVLQSR